MVVSFTILWAGIPSHYHRWLAPNEEEAQSFSLPTWSNLTIFPGGRQDPEILKLEAASSPEWFQERYGGIPCPPRGLVFGEFRNEIHTGLGGKFSFEPDIPVQLWVDPGFQHYYAVLVVQKKGEDVYVVDEIYEKGLVTSEMVIVAKQKPWFNKVTGGAIDVSGTFHQGMSAPAAEIWLNEGKVFLQSQKIKISDGIERVKSCLLVNPITNRPRLFINARCRGLISEMGGCVNPQSERQEVYSWKMDKDGNVLGDAPKDEHNDACKALAYGLINMLGYTESAKKPTTVYY